MPTLLQLAARSNCRGCRCLPTGLVSGKGVCQPPLEPNSASAESGTNPGADIVLVAPLWKAQPRYPLLLSMLMDWPSPLPHQNLLTPVGKMSLSPQLVVWSILGKASESRAFLNRRQASLTSPGGLRPSLMTHSSSDVIAGVVNRVPIPFQDL